jgi:hypothetical protein
MPFALIIVGVVLLITSVRNTYGVTQANGQPGLGGLLQKDFTGTGNFIFWLVALLIIGAVGYIPKLKPISTALLVLVILVLFLTRGNPQSGTGGGFFQQFVQQISSTQSATSSSSIPSTSLPTTGSLIPTLPTLPSIPSIGGF